VSEVISDEITFTEGMSDEEAQGILAIDLQDAIDFCDNVISPARAEAEKFYLGDEFGNEEEGRSQVISTDVRDTIQGILPSLMRIFFGGEHTVEFAPQNAEDVEVAQQATDYVNYVVNRDNNGFSVLYDAFKDSLMKKVGFVKFYWDESEKVESYDFSGYSEQELAVLEADPEVEINRIEQLTEVQEDGSTFTLGFSGSYTRVMRNGKVRIESVPPEEFLIARNARTIEDADLVAHRRYATLSELVEMGYDYDEVEGYATYEDDFQFNPEANVRNPTLSDYDVSNDPTMRRALYIESYVRMDVDGDNRAELRRICTIGESYEILRNDPTDHVPFVAFHCEKEPHTFFGLSIADVTSDIQKIKSMVLRASLDSLALSTHPRVAFVEGQANIDDILNTEVGGVIRMRNPGAVTPFNIPFVGQQAFPMLEYMDLIREQRTGQSRASDGLDPGALQSSTNLAVAQTINASQQRTEMIARFFAETGMKDLFMGVYQLIIKYQDKPRMVRLRNNFVPVDPSVWNANMDVVTNVALGRSSDAERMGMLQQVAAKQEQILQVLGPQNPLTGIQNYYQTLTQMLELAGFKDPNRFFTDPSTVPPQPQEPPKPDPNEMLAEVQMEQIRADIQKKSAELELRREEMMRTDDRLRDKEESEILLKVAELEAKYGTQVDLAEIKAVQEQDREMMRVMAGGQQ
tara:strand:- start:10466 stop:12532 length:2067 start_codon:yes stop_codon:yes gene_type:complete